MAATKSIIADLNQGEKRNEKNYDVWHHKIQYILEKQDMLETITQPTTELEQITLLNIGVIWNHIKPISAKIVWLAFCC